MADDAVIDVEPLFILAVILIDSRGFDGSGPAETRVVKCQRYRSAYIVQVGETDDVGQ